MERRPELLTWLWLAEPSRLGLAELVSDRGLPQGGCAVPWRVRIVLEPAVIMPRATDDH